MNDLKMSDVFNLPLYVHENSVMCQGVIRKDCDHELLVMSPILYLGDENALVERTAHAINSHDKLVEINKEMHDLLALMIENDVINDVTLQLEAETLLAKAKGE